MAEGIEVVKTAPGELRLVGEFDVAGVLAFDQALDGLRAAPGDRVVLDCSALTFLSSSGISSLVRARQAYPKLVLRAPGAAVVKVLEITALLDSFDIDPDPCSPTDRSGCGSGELG